MITVQMKARRKKWTIVITDVLTARAAAVRAVADVLARQIPLELALSNQLGYNAMDSRDRAFARLISATTFRRLGQIDGVLKAFVKQTPPRLVMAALQTGAAQILYLGTPAHAAVGETVDLLKSNPKTKGFSGMVNAVLRRVSERGPALAAAIAPQENLPKWLRVSWEKAYGRPAMRKMARAVFSDPPLDLSVRGNTADWAKRLDGEVIGPQTIRLPHIGTVTDLEGYGEGQWWAQDVAASLPVDILGDVSGLSVLDMCAAPGGKTLQLASRGAQVTALDRSEDRLLRMKDNLVRTSLSAELVCADAREYSHIDGFDIVLLDAPCSATGTFRRHPDVIHNKTPRDVQSLVKLQKQLLKVAAALVKQGGSLVYCTCSLQKDEGEDRVSHFLTDMPEFRLNPILTDSVLSIPQSVTAEGYIRTQPQFLAEKGGVDGFFIARLGRE